MFGLGLGEILVILLVALIFLGPKKLPELAKGLGIAIREFQKASRDFKHEMMAEDNAPKSFDAISQGPKLESEMPKATPPEVDQSKSV